MKKIIFQDGDRQQEIVLRDGTNVDELYYRTYRFQRNKGWFDFDWATINKLEDARLHELIPDLKYFNYGGKVYVHELTWHCHLYSIELGKDTLTMADKIIQKFYGTVKEPEFLQQNMPQSQNPGPVYALLEEIDQCSTKLYSEEKTLSYTDPAKDVAKYATYQASVATLRAELDALLQKKQALRNPYWVPGVSSEQPRIKFAIFKKGAERSTCNITFNECQNGIPEKIQKQLLKEIEKDPTFTYTLKMFLVFDYLDALPDAASAKA